jgi:hypothetical protein
VPTAALFAQPGVGRIAFGKFMSPDWETPGKIIPPIGTRNGVPTVQATNEIYFNLVLPAGAPPAGGWPVAMFGHGFGDNKNNSPPLVAATMANHGIATIAINVVGHGFGTAGTLRHLGRDDGNPIRRWSGDQPGRNTTIGLHGGHQRSAAEWDRRQPRRAVSDGGRPHAARAGDRGSGWTWTATASPT